MMNMARVLVVEDDAIIAEDLRRSLKRMGHDVLAIARSSDEALRAVDAVRPQLILMDIKLKGPVDGIATATLIRRQAPIALVYLTSHSDAATLSRAAATEPSGYVVKPFHEPELRATIERALAQLATPVSS